MWEEPVPSDASVTAQRVRRAPARGPRVSSSSVVPRKLEASQS